MKTKMTFDKARKLYIQQGGKFFTDKVINYSGTEIVTPLYENNCFITSEYDMTGRIKFYNVRQFSKDYKHIHTIGNYNHNTSFKEAKNLLKRVKI